jgi:AcrR family transcriptional regulator
VPEAARARRRPAGAAVLQPDKTEAIVAAVFEELAEHGYRGLSMDRVAARAGVGKAALYRRWSSKQAMIVDAVATVATQAALPPDTGSLRGDALAFIEDGLAATQHPIAGRVIADLAAEAQRSPELAEALLARFRDPRRAAAGAMLERAVERGEVAPDVDVQVALHLIAGPVYLRAVFPGETLDATYPERLADAFLRAVGASDRQRRT